MTRFLAGRAAQAVVLLFGVSLLLFLMMHTMPGGPMAQYAHQPGITKETLALIAKSYGLDQPVMTQYLDWLGQAFRGRFGYSFVYGLPALGLVFQRLPATLELMVPSYVLAVTLAFVVGVFSAVHPYTLWDYVLQALSYIGISVPTFFLGLVLVIVFAVHLGWFPPSGVTSATGGAGLGDRVAHLVLPVTVLTAYYLASQSRYVRASVLDVIHSDFVRTARAKGLSEGTVLRRHVLRNALLPVVTVMVLDGAYMFAGAAVTETVFSWPGMGRLFVQAVSQGDYPVLMVEVTFLAIVVVLANIVADVLYAVLDPRVRLG